jgi:CDP-glucose 4,6-dehydratase
MFEFYKNKKIFITGHTGFKGSWLSLWLTKLGSDVCGYSLSPNTEPNLFNILNLKSSISKSVIGDILNVDMLEDVMMKFQPDVVFHLAAQPLVRRSYSEPLLTYKTNVIGTLNVFEAARKCNVPVVNITTDKVYENKECDIEYREDDNFGGYDIYSSSKACSEILTSSYRRSFSQKIASARAGNVIGGGDWAIDRLIPDCIRAINENKPIVLRNPKSVRPWQFVLEPLCGYLLLGENLVLNGEKFSQAFNFGPVKPVKVLDVVRNVIKFYGKGEFIINKTDDLHEANLLMLNSSKAFEYLNWMPKYNCTEAIKLTVDWYKNFYNNSNNIIDYTLSQIDDYEELWKKN